MGCCTGFARFLLFIFNFIFWLSGVAILAVGIWIVADPDFDKYQKVIEDSSTEGDFLKVGAYILIGFGAFIFLVGFCGCCGAIRKSKCLLGIYIVCLVIVLAGELSAGIYVAVKRDDVEDDLNKKLKDVAWTKHYDNLKGAWDVVQSQLECCGPDGPSDYRNGTQVNNGTIPESCCIKKNDDPDFVKCKTETMNYVYKKGCLGKLKTWVEDHSTYIMGVAIGLAAIEIIGFICACFFCRNMDRDD